MHDADRRFRQVLDSCRDAFIEVDEDLVVTEWTRRAEAMTGWSRADVVGRPISTVLAPHYCEVVEQAVAVVRSSAATWTDDGEGTPVAPRDLEIEFRHRDGATLLASATVFSAGDRSDLRLCAFLHDVSRETAPEVGPLARDRLHDPLTGLPGRALFIRRLAVAIESLATSAGSVAVVVFDIDRFKTINDSMGHDAGDDLLEAVVSRLRLATGAVRPLLARLGGDEFLALFEHDGSVAGSEAELFAARMLEELADPFDVGGTEVFLAASMGIAATADVNSDAALLLANADAAMHQTKAEGGGSYKVFGEAMRRNVVERMSTEHSLHRALDRRELTLFYQPVVDITRSNAVAVEALLRWQHPEQGLMAPERFIPVAEESGLIIPIGAWVMEEACRQLRRWHEGGLSGPAASVEVNLSARQVEHPDIVPTVEGILAATGLAPQNLTLEITESALMHDAVPALEVLSALKAIGVCLAIDDFGTGYSSLSYLQRFPLDMLKVDKSFVDELDVDQGTEIVSAIINLAHALGLQVVAEGVETEKQLAVLRQLGCDFAQGYLFSRPVPAAQVAPQFSIGA